MFSLFSDLQESDAWPVYQDTLVSMEENRDSVSPKFVLDRVGKFVRHRRLVTDVIEAARILQGPDGDRDERIEEVEKMLLDGRKASDGMFDIGVRFPDIDRVWRTDDEDQDVVLTGIETLDRRRMGPRRGQMHLMVAPSKTGKTWWGVHLSKIAAVRQQKSVLYITLEISAEDIMKRIHSSMFSISRTEAKGKVAEFEKDKLGRITGLAHGESKARIAVTESDFRPWLKEHIDRWEPRTKIIVKEFSSGSLTPGMLEAYLVQLASRCSFVPDMVILDYADLMKVSAANLRLELDRIFVEIRGLAQEHNFALVTMTQANRRGAESKSGVGVHHVAEAWSKIATADTVLTLSRTPEEEKFGLARLKVAASRVGQDGITVMISQDYAAGQFILDEGYPTGDLYDSLKTEE